MTTYTPLGFANGAAPALSGTNLNYIEAGVVAAHAAVAAHSAYFDAEAYTPSHTDLQAIHAACAAATAAGQANMVRLSARTWDVGNGLSMADYTCGLVGMGAGHDGTNPTGTVLHASTQTGAVLDLTGWVCPGSFRGKVEFGNFSLRGSGVADATKVKIGLRRATDALGATRCHDIVVLDTGGACLDIFKAYLCDFERILAVTPVSAQANDVPYMIFRGCNGNRFGLGFYSLAAAADVGVSGALVVTDDGTYHSESNEWIAPWFENLHIPTNGTLIANKANMQNWRAVYFVDCSKEAGATGTSYATFAPSAFTNYGGNIWDGLVPGGDPTGATVPDVGILMSQSRNRIAGTKGYNGRNVTVTTGVDYTYVHLAGAVSGAGGPAVLDNSGLTGTDNHNVFIDEYLNTQRRAALVVQRPDDAGKADIYLGTEAAGSLIYQNGTAGGLYLRTSGNYQGITFQHAWDRTSLELNGGGGAPGVRGYAPSASDPAFQSGTNSKYGLRLQGAGGPVVCAGEGSPESVLAAPVGSTYMRSDGGAGTCQYVKESGAGSTGWIAK